MRTMERYNSREWVEKRERRGVGRERKEGQNHGEAGGTRCRAEQMKLYKRQSTKFIALAKNKKMLQRTKNNKKSDTITALTS